MLYFSAEKRQDSGLLVTARLGLKRLIQIGEEIVQRVVGDAPAKRVVGDLDGAFEIGSGIVVQYRAVWLITDANLAAGIDGAAGPLPFHLKHQVVGGLDLRDFDDDTVGAFQTRQRRGDIGSDAAIVEQFNRVATGDARLQNAGIENSIEHLLAGRFEFVTSGKFHRTLPQENNF